MPRSPDRIGDVVADRYELLDVVGRGGQGLVYKAFDRWMGRSVAIKVLGSKAAREPQMAQRMIREQQALSALKGTAAVELFDVCVGKDGELCLVMELLSGVDLDEYLYTIEERDERLDLRRIAEIFDPIVETLEVAHAAGILHRDLKPANVFLLEAGGVRLLDFGLARLKSATPLTAAGTIMGSPSFMAPEAWKGLSDLVDHRADVYSLGVILFRCVSGELPFSGESLHEKFLGTTKGARPSLLALRKDLPRDADEWVALALAVDRAERFSNVRAMWNAFLSTFDVQPPRRGKQPSIWAAAKSAVQRLAHASDRPEPAPSRAAEPPPSYGREALARSVLMPGAQVTPDFDSGPREPGGSSRPAPRQKPSAPPRPAAEKTMELTDADFSDRPPPPPPPRRTRPVETTLELSDTELVFAEDTIPEASKPEPIASSPSNGTPSAAERKKERNRRRKERKKRRRGKGKT